jgi:peptidoglycan/LPS O-acetylase OafA/YrhL
MQPNPFILRLGILAVIAGFAALFAWLLWDVWYSSTTPYDPNDLQVYLIPPVAGALGIGLALQLGVSPKIEGEPGWKDRLWSLIDPKRLIGLGSIVLFVAVVVGIFVWASREDETPELVTTLILTVVGYLVAAYAAAARGGKL